MKLYTSYWVCAYKTNSLIISAFMLYRMWLIILNYSQVIVEEIVQ